MNTAMTADTVDAHARRWRDWRLKNEHRQRKGARRARVVFTVIFVAVALWLGVQIVYSQVG